MKRILTVFIALAALTLTTSAQDLAGVLAIAGAVLKPYGMNGSYTMYTDGMPGWKSRWQISFRYGPMDIMPRYDELGSWSVADITREQSMLTRRLAMASDLSASEVVEYYKPVSDEALDAAGRLFSCINTYGTSIVLQRDEARNRLVIKPKTDLSAVIYAFEWKALETADPVLAELVRTARGGYEIDTFHPLTLDAPADDNQDDFYSALKSGVPGTRVIVDDDRIAVCAPSAAPSHLRWTYNLGYQFFNAEPDSRLYGAAPDPYQAVINANGPFVSAAGTWAPWTSGLGELIRFTLYSTMNIMMPASISVTTTVQDTMRAFSINTVTSLGFELGAGMTVRLVKGLTIYGNVLLGSAPLRGSTVEAGDTIEAWEDTARKQLPTTLYGEWRVGLMAGIAASF